MKTKTIAPVAAIAPAELLIETPVEPAPRPRSLLNARQSMRVTTAAQALASAQENAELAALMARFGYSPEKIAQGIALQASARQAFALRQQSIAAHKQTRAALYELNARVRRAYANFRVVARAAMRSAEMDQALLLEMEPPTDLRKFVTMAHATYQTAQNTSAYLDVLALLNYTETELQQLDAQVTELEQALTAHQNALAHVRASKVARDRAVMRLDAWMIRFRAIARVALRDRPDLAGLVGVSPL